MPTPIDISTLWLTAMLEMEGAQREAEEAHRRAAEEARRRVTEELQRADEEAKRKAEEDKNKLEERKKRKRRRQGMVTDAPHAAGSAKRQCTFSGEEEKPKRRKRMDEVELQYIGGKGDKKSRQLSPGELDLDLEEADEKISVVAALKVLAEKLEQLTSAVAEGFVLHRKE